MSTSPAVQTDPYLLPLPAPSSLVVLPHLVHAMHAHLNVRYAEPVWPLAPLTGNPTVAARTIYWRTCPAVFCDEIRLVAWNLINGRLRPTYLRQRGTRLRARLSMDAVHHAITEWIKLAQWLAEQDIRSLAHCGTNVLHDYAQRWRDSGIGRMHAQRNLAALTRLWAFDQLSAAPTGIGRPPWEDHGADDYLPAATSAGGENATEPLAEHTMGPLLIWAMRVVDELAPDILAASTERQRLIDAARTNASTDATAAALREYLGPLITAHAPLPTTTHQGAIVPARQYIAGITGASPGQVSTWIRREGLTAAAAQRPGPCPLDIPVLGRIAGKPWRTALDFTEAPTLMRHLGTAAFIVCAYLTGARTGEILGLRSGCCPDPAPDDTGAIGRHLIRSTVFKTAVDDHGNHQSAGVERPVPWVAIQPVVNAIRVLETMVPSGALLFGHDAHELRARPRTGVLKPCAIRDRIEEFVVWANTEAHAHGQLGELIPPDPNGAIGTARFRRILSA